MAETNKPGTSIDTLELCKKIEEQISICGKINTAESSRLANEVLRPSLFCIKLNEAILKELAQIGCKHFV